MTSLSIAVTDSVESPLARKRYAALVTFGFLVIAGIANIYHEPWRDETQAWLVARDPPTLWAFLEQVNRASHPGVWYALLRLASSIGTYWVTPVINLAFATAASWLFVRFAPFARMTRSLFVFGYLPLFEYGVIARNYAVGVFLLFLFAVLFSRRRTQPWLLALVLALAANTSLHAALVAIGATAVLVVEWIAEDREKRSKAAFGVAIAISLVGILLCAITVLPPHDFRLGNIWHSRPIAKRLLATLGSLPQAFTSSPWLKTPGVPGLAWLQVPVLLVGIPLSILFSTTAFFRLASRKIIWLLAAIPIGGCLVLFFDRSYGGARHAGFLFMATLLALWLAPEFPERTPGTNGTGAHRWAKRHLERVLTWTFAWNALGAFYAVCIEVLFVFSAGKDTAKLIVDNQLDALPIVAAQDFYASNVVAYLGKKPAFYANVDRSGTFVVLDDRHGKNNRYADAPDDSVIFNHAAERSDQSAVVILLNRQAKQDGLIATRAREIGHRHAQVFNDESFWVYLVPPRTQKARVGH